MAQRYSGELGLNICDHGALYEVSITAPGARPVTVKVNAPAPGLGKYVPGSPDTVDRVAERALDSIAQSAPELAQRAEGLPDGSTWIVSRTAAPRAVPPPDTEANGTSRSEWRLSVANGADLYARVQVRSGKLVVSIAGRGFAKVDRLAPGSTARNLATHRRAVANVMRRAKRRWDDMEPAAWGSSHVRWPEEPAELPAARPIFAPPGRRATRANDGDEALREAIESRGDFAHGGDVEGAVAAWRSGGFEPEEAASWLDARCFDPFAAGVLRGHNVTPEMATKIVGPERGHGHYSDTLGYKCANGDMGAEDALVFIAPIQTASNGRSAASAEVRGPVVFERVDSSDGASERLMVVRFDDGRRSYVSSLGRRTPFAVQVDNDSDFYGLFDLDGDRINLGSGASWQAAKKVPGDVVAAIEHGWAHGSTSVARVNAGASANPSRGAATMPNMNQTDARKHFMQEILPRVPRRDLPAASVAWSAYLDDLRQQRLITAAQVDRWVYSEPAVRKAIGLSPKGKGAWGNGASEASGRRAAAPRTKPSVDAVVVSAQKKRRGLNNYYEALVRLDENGKTSFLRLELTAHWGIVELPDELSEDARHAIIAAVNAKHASRRR